jgi:nucleotide-binding universal stress UspA family protein
MTRLNTIVAGLDLSVESEPALSQAKALAKAHDARLILLHASGLTDASVAMQDEAVRTAAPWQRYVEERMAKAEAMLENAVTACREDGVNVTSRLSHGHPDAVVVSAAHEEHADLVVCGTHDREGHERWLLGSVAERIMRLSNKHVLVAREQTPARGALDRLLVATDFSSTADRGLRLALDLAAPDATILVVHCWEPPHSYGVAPPDEMTQKLKIRAQERGNQLIAQLGGGRNIKFELLTGPPVDTLVDRLHTDAHDLLVIGSHGRRGVRRVVLGSVAEHATRIARKSVLVAHGLDEEGGDHGDENASAS